MQLIRGLTPGSNCAAPPDDVLGSLIAASRQYPQGSESAAHERLELDDIATRGDIPLGTVQAFEQAAVAREARNPWARFGRRKPKVQSRDENGGMPFDDRLRF